MIHLVVISEQAQRQLRKVPNKIAEKPRTWSTDVQNRGLEAVRLVPGYHDHPLKGQLKGLRAISLNKQWRAVYRIEED